MNDEFIKEQLGLAVVVEKLASYTVGVGVPRRPIGTGRSFRTE